MSAEDVLTEAGWRGVRASRSDKERDDLLKIVGVFNQELRAHVREGDVPGILAGTYVFRAGKQLGGGLVLTLQDRAIVGWMKGFIKRPRTEVIPLSSIAAVELRNKRVSGRTAPLRAIFLEAAEDWELLCSPDVPEDAPLYELLCALLSGSIKAERWPDDDSLPVVP